MLLKDRHAIIYGAGGAVGSAVARAFAREGAKLFLTGRDLAKVQPLAKELSAEAAKVDALDEEAVEKHAASVGRIDISFNAIGIPQRGIQGIPLVDLSAESFSLPIATYTLAQFVTARAAA